MPASTKSNGVVVESGALDLEITAPWIGTLNTATVSFETMPLTNEDLVLIYEDNAGYQHEIFRDDPKESGLQYYTLILGVICDSGGKFILQHPNSDDMQIVARLVLEII